MKNEVLSSPIGEYSINREGLQRAIDEIVELRMLSLKLSEVEKYALYFILKVFKKTQSYKRAKKYSTEILKKLENYRDYSSTYSDDEGYDFDLVDEIATYKSAIYKPRIQNEHRAAQELNALYAKFWDEYDEECFHFGRKFLSRLKNNHYKSNMLKSLISIMNWFDTNYDRKKHILSFGCFPHFTISDKEKNEFAGYVWHKGDVYFRPEFTAKRIEVLKEADIFNPSTHYIVSGLMDWRSSPNS